VLTVLVAKVTALGYRPGARMAARWTTASTPLIRSSID
jgi:hypothetical protein